MTKTWNLTLMATDDRPQTTVRGLTEDAARDLLLRLVYDSPEAAHEYLEEVVAPHAPEALVG